MISRKYLSFPFFILSLIFGSVFSMHEQKAEFGALPDDVLLVIFSYDDLPELLHKKSLVCKKWKNIVDELLEHREHQNVNVPAKLKWFILPKYKKERKNFENRYHNTIAPARIQLAPLQDGLPFDISIKNEEDKSKALANIKKLGDCWWKDKKAEMIGNAKDICLFVGSCGAAYGIYYLLRCLAVKLVLFIGKIDACSILTDIYSGWDGPLSTLFEITSGAPSALIVPALVYGMGGRGGRENIWCLFANGTLTIILVGGVVMKYSLQGRNATGAFFSCIQAVKEIFTQGSCKVRRLFSLPRSYLTNWFGGEDLEPLEG